MLYLGIDLHKESLTMACLDLAGVVLWIKTLSTKCVNKIRERLDAFDQPYAVAIEAVGFYHWLWDMLGDQPAQKCLADPREVRARKAIKRAKTDRKDAVLLHQMTFLENKLALTHDRIRKRRGRRKAATAVARRLIIWLWRMSCNRSVYNPDMGR